ncbi:MAG TPA: hypothetical protein VJP89_11595 [Pyrinomonadaceae bacterium]|nr:hypothetical protein [Pyrinomonadaceae bacterium]
MSNEPEQPRDLDFEQAQLAYSIIDNLIDHTRIVSDLIALMAQVLDEDTTKALTQTPTWSAYLDSRRSMEKTRGDIERFAEILNKLQPDDTDA